MNEHILQLLSDLDGFTLDVNSYYDDSGYTELVDSLTEGKLKALALSLDRLRLVALAKEVRDLKWERGGVIPILEVLRGSISPNLKATLKQGGWL